MSEMNPDMLETFRLQAVASRDLGSEFIATLAELMAARLDRNSTFGIRILDWPGNSRADALALRAAGGLHALARSGRDAGLAAAYPPNPLDPDRLWAAVTRAIAAHDAFLTAYLDSPPQTNEVRRSAIIMGGCLHIAAATGLPIALFEIGASAGLNLALDRYHYDFGNGLAWGDPASPVTIPSEWRGELPPLDTPLAIASRRGCDLRPISPASAADRVRLLSYIWPDQGDRLARTVAALDLAAAAPWRVEQADAADWVAAHLPHKQQGRVRVLVQTMVWHYFPQPAKDAITGTLAAAAVEATADAPLAWLRMDEEGHDRHAVVRLTLWPGGVERHIANADYHGRWTEWFSAGPRPGDRPPPV